MAAEAERSGKRERQRCRSGLVRCDVEITFRVGLLIVDRRRDQVVFERLDRSERLERNERSDRRTSSRRIDKEYYRDDEFDR